MKKFLAVSLAAVIIILISPKALYQNILNSIIVVDPNRVCFPLVFFVVILIFVLAFVHFFRKKAGTNDEYIENGNNYFEKNLIAIFISACVSLVLILIIWKGYNRGLDNFNYWGLKMHQDWALAGLSRVKPLFYLFLAFIIWFFFFLRLFILTDMKNKVLKGLFIFPFILTLCADVYFRIFEGNITASSMGISQGGFAVFFAEIFAIVCYAIFLKNFWDKKGDLNKADYFLLIALIVHPFLIFAISSMIIKPFNFNIENIAKSKYQEAQNIVLNEEIKNKQNKQSEPYPSYDDAKIIKTSPNMPSRITQINQIISSIYGAEHMDWNMQGMHGIPCKKTDDYTCQKTDIILKDGSEKSLIFKIYNEQ